MKKIFYSLLSLGVVSAPAYVLAASPFLKPVKDLLGDLEIFINFLNWALPALAVIVFMGLIVMFIYKRMRGSTEDAGFAKSTNIIAALIALALLFTVYGLIQLLGALVGIDTNRSKTITAPSLPQVGGVRSSGYYYGSQ